MGFLLKIITHPETKRGASHLLVGIAISAVSALIFRDDGGVPPINSDA